MWCYFRRNSLARWWRVALAATIAILTSAEAPGAGPTVPSWLRGELAASAGIEVSSGDYGIRADTAVLYVPFAVTYRPDDFGLTAYRRDWIEVEVTVPYLRVRSPVYAGGTPTSIRQTDGGLGDVVTRLSYLIAPPGDTWLPFVEVAGRVKAPTADAGDFLGTGKTDVGLELTFSKAFGNFMPFGSLGHHWLGDPADYDLQNRWLVSAGLVSRVSSEWSLGLLYEWRQTAATWSEDAHELLPYASIQVNPYLGLQTYGIVGLSDGSPNWGAGLQFRAAIPLR